MTVKYKVRRGQKQSCFESRIEHQARAVYDALVGTIDPDSKYPPYFDLVEIEKWTNRIDERTTETVLRTTILECSEGVV